MLRPITEFLSCAPKLHRVNRIRALHHHALEEIAAERAVGLAELLVVSERVSV